MSHLFHYSWLSYSLIWSQILYIYRVQCCWIIHHSLYLNLVPELPLLENRNWLIHLHYSRKEFGICKILLQEELEKSNGMCEYAHYVQVGNNTLSVSLNICWDLLQSNCIEDVIFWDYGFKVLWRNGFTWILLKHFCLIFSLLGPYLEAWREDSGISWIFSDMSHSQSKEHKQH